MVVTAGKKSDEYKLKSRGCVGEKQNKYSVLKLRGKDVPEVLELTHQRDI